MNDRNWGGARKGAGHPVVGKTSKCMTLTFTIEQAEQLKALAEEADLTVSQYVVDKCGLAGGPVRKTAAKPKKENQEESENPFRVSFEDFGMLKAAEMESPSYKVEKKD